MVLMAICPVDGTPMPAFWPGTKKKLRYYCSEHCRSKGTMQLRLEREQADMDEIAVERLVQGDHSIVSTQAERMEAALRLSRHVDTGLNAAGHYRGGRWGVVSVNPTALMTATEIGNRIGVSASTAARYLRLLAEPRSILTAEQARTKAEHLFARCLHRMTLVGWYVEGSR
jgi:hypothetical protein